MSHAHHATKVTTEDAEAGVNVKMIVAVGAVSLLIFAVSAVIAYFLLGANLAALDKEQGMSPEGALIGQPEIGIIEMVPFDEDTRLAKWRKQTQQQANEYGWADRKANRVRLPISVGIKKAIDEAAGPAKAPVPVAPEQPQQVGIDVPTFGQIPGSLKRESLYQGAGALEGGTTGPVGAPIGAAALPAPKADPGKPVLQEGPPP